MDIPPLYGAGVIDGSPTPGGVTDPSSGGVAGARHTIPLCSALSATESVAQDVALLTGDTTVRVAAANRRLGLVPWYGEYIGAMDGVRATGGAPAEATRDPMADWPTGRLLSTASRLIEHTWQQALDGIGVTHAGLIVLHLLDSGPASQKELARRARVQNQTMSRTLDRLQRAGHIERIAAVDDRRRHVVSRTPAGDDAWNAAHRLEADVFPELPDESALRDQLLAIIRSGESARWSPEDVDSA